MGDPTDKASMRLEGQRRHEAQAACGFPPRARRPDSCVSVAVSDPADEERVRLALGRTEKAARLLEEAFLFVVGENELFTSTLEQHYAALLQAEVSEAALEARLMWGHRRAHGGHERTSYGPASP